MEKPKLSINFVFIASVLALIIVAVLTAFSILGENHKINRVIQSYFANVKDGMYLEACAAFSSKMEGEQLLNDEQRMNFNFLLESALVKRYNLVDVFDYKVDVERSNFWIPFVSGDSVGVSVALRKRDDNRAPGSPPRLHEGGLTRNLIVVGRERGSWKIRRFAIAGSSLADTYHEVRQAIDLNRYVQKTPGGFRFKDAEIDLKTMTPLDKRLLRFSLYKIQQSLGKDAITLGTAKKGMF